jgi:hypothetical protein
VIQTIPHAGQRRAPVSGSPLLETLPVRDPADAVAVDEPSEGECQEQAGHGADDGTASHGALGGDPEVTTTSMRQWVRSS